jgi:hypothetical protein
MADSRICPSCGTNIGADRVCPTCGFMVRRGAEAWAGASDRTPPNGAAAGMARPLVGGGAWAPRRPSPVTAPAPVTPPSQLSPGRLEVRETGHFTGRTAGAAAMAAASAAAAAGVTAASRAPAPVAAQPVAGPEPRQPGRNPRPFTPSQSPAPVVTFESWGKRSSSGSAVVPSQAWSAPLVATGSQGNVVVVPPAWWHASPGAAVSAGAAVPATRRAGRRAPLWTRRRRGLALVLMVLGFLVLLQLSESYERAHQSSLLPTPVNSPSSGDLGTVRLVLAELADITTSPAARVGSPRPAAARRARLIRDELTVWRDQFDLTARQTRSLDHAIAYARALARWFKAPNDAPRQAAAIRTWRAWRAHDPMLISN